MAGGKAKRVTKPQIHRVLLQAYTLGTTVQVPQLPLRDEDYPVIVIFTYANINSMFLMPATAMIPAGTRNLIVYNAWDTNTKTLKTSGNVDLYIFFVE
jgi:hypothetical protein